MSKLSGGASYLTKESVPAKRLSTSKKSPVMVAVSAFFALLVLFMSAQPLMASVSGTSNNKASAGSAGLVCSSDIGLGMDERSNWEGFLRVYPLPNEKNRVWTLQEAFGSGLSFVNYEGEGKTSEPIVRDKSPENTNKPGNYDAVNDKLEGLRTFQTCFNVGGLTYVSNAIIGLANLQSNIVQAFVVFAFDSNIICEDPANPSGVCINLLKVIGGTGDMNGGLIGTLTGSIYMPLLVIAVAITGFWVGYKGLVQRKLREAMFGAIWVCLSVIFGLALLLNPALLARAPMAVSNAVGTCIIGSFSGQNCMDDSTKSLSLETDNLSSSSGKICRSIAPGAALDAQMSMTVNSLSCSIWKAFVLEPYAQGSFGTSFEKLDVTDTDTKRVIEKAGLDPNTFCVNLGSSESLASFSGKRAVFDRDTGKVCNLLAYQMFLKTNASTTGSVTPDSGEIDPRWYNVIVTAAHDEGLWTQWAPSGTNAMHKIATGAMAGFTGFIGGIILVVIAFFALVYYLTSVILMAFAPLFFLMGVHPGRGKKILMGWLEKVVSNVLKYLASALFLIVAISFYAAILGAASNPALTFIFVIIMSGALFMYRKEVIDLVGKVSMGGEQLSSSFSDKLKERAAGVGGLAMAGIGSGVGAKIAGGRLTSGIKAGVQRDLQRGGATKIFGKTGGDLVSNATRQFARNTVDNERDVKAAAGKAQAEAGTAELELATVKIENDEAVAKVDDFDIAFYTDQNELADLDRRKASYSEMETEAAREMMEDNPYFAQAQLLLNQMSALEFDKGVALAIGDVETADLKTAEIQQLNGQRETLLSAIDSDELTSNREEYSSRLEDKIFRSNVNYTDDDEATRHGLTALTANAQSTRDVLVASANALTDRKNELEVSSASLKVTKEQLHNESQNLQPGDMLNKKTADKMIADAEKAGQLAGAKAPQSDSYVVNRSMEEVYNEQHARLYVPEGPPTSGSRGPTDDGRGPNGPIDGGSGPQNPGPTRGGPPLPSDTSGSDGLTPTTAAAPTRTLPTSPQSPASAASAVDAPRQSGGLPTSQGRQPAPVLNDSLLTYESAPPANAPASSNNTDEERFERARAERSQAARRELAELLADRQIGEAPVRSAYAPTPEEVQATRRELAELLASAPTSQQGRQSAPAATARPRPDATAQPVVAPSVTAQPTASPQIPSQPTSPPRVEAQQSTPAPVVAPPAPVRAPTPQPESAPRIPAQPAAPPVQAPSAQRPSPQQAPAAPTQEPRIPTQPSRPPASSSAPESGPTTSPRSAPVQQSAAAPAPQPVAPIRPPTSATPISRPSAPTAATPSAPIPAAPARPPVVPPQPSAPPAPAPSPAPTPARNREERGAPLAREIRLPSAPQVSRITENSEIPTVSIQRENPSDNEAQTRGRGLPRRRNPRNE